MRVLVVDDSRAMRLILCRALRQSSLRLDEIRECDDGASAPAIIAEFDPQLVLCESNVSGIELMSRLRAHGDQRAFGFVTSEPHPDVCDDAMDSATAFLLAMPFNGDRIDAALGHLVA